MGLINVEEVLILVGDLPAGKADGLDGIPACLLKASISYIAGSLTHIFNLVIFTGIIPRDWKIARVTPIFKADSRFGPNNYRPTSVLSVTAKLFERAIFSQTYRYLLNENNLLTR